MPRNDSYGTRRMGRFEQTINGHYVWSSADDDPYQGLRIGALDWFDSDMNARDVVARILVDSEDEVEFDFSDRTCTWEARLAEAEETERCRVDPEYFVSYFKEHLMYPPTYQHLLAAAKSYHSDGIVYVCVNPRCHYMWFVDDSAGPMIMKCRSCAAYAMIHEHRIGEGLPPDAAIMTLAAWKLKEVASKSRKNRIVFEIAEQNEHCVIGAYDNRPYLRMRSSAPQLKTNGDHFIRARVNREVLEEYQARSEAADGDVLAYFIGMSVGHIESIGRLMADESLILDPSRADKFRQEYIDTRWDEEFATFVGKLKDSGILLVDSSGVGDTLTALYHLAQKKVGAKTIITTSGKIRFPTSKVLENINPFLMSRAFSATEHSLYVEPSEVFRLDEGAGE